MVPAWGPGKMAYLSRGSFILFSLDTPVRYVHPHHSFDFYITLDTPVSSVTVRGTYSKYYSKFSFFLVFIIVLFFL